MFSVEDDKKIIRRFMQEASRVADGSSAYCYGFLISALTQLYGEISKPAQKKLIKVIDDLHKAALESPREAAVIVERSTLHVWKDEPKEVINRGLVMKNVGIGWIEMREATFKDYAELPVVK